MQLHRAPRPTAAWIAGAVLTCGLINESMAIVGGARDCATNSVNTPGEGCSYPTVGNLDLIIERSGRRTAHLTCTLRLIYNGPEKAVALTAAHCVALLGNPNFSYGVNFDSQIVDDTVVPYRTSLPLDRVIAPDLVIPHPRQRSSSEPGVDPPGNSQLYTVSDAALLVIDDADKLARLRSLWHLPEEGALAGLPAENSLDSNSPGTFRSLQLLDAGYGLDWVDYDDPSGRYNIGTLGDYGFRSVATLTPVGISAERIMTAQNQQKDLEGTCYGDSGSSAFVRDPVTGETTLVAMPTWADDGGTKCHSTVQWVRLDRPNMRDFIACAFLPGDGDAVRECVATAFPGD